MTRRRPAVWAGKAGLWGARLAGACTSAYSRRVFGRRILVGALVLGFAAGCSAAAEPYTADADSGSVHALVSIERRASAGTDESAQAQAFASFVRTPAEVDPTIVARITGLDLDLPDPGECELASNARERSVPLSPLRRVELLDAGAVALETPSGRVELAPRAFPAVTDLVGGVVYSTRDRAAALPSGEVYALAVDGTRFFAPFSLSAEAPPPLADLKLAGALLAEGAGLDARGTELAWTSGSSRDLVYVVISGADASRFSTCTFRDDAGRGSLPASALPPPGAASLSVHRLRSVALGEPVDAGELRFDFELFARVEVQAP